MFFLESILKKTFHCRKDNFLRIPKEVINLRQAWQTLKLIFLHIIAEHKFVYMKQLTLGPM